MIKSKEQAERIQKNRHAAEKRGLAKAVGRWNKRNPGQAVIGPVNRRRKVVVEEAA